LPDPSSKTLDFYASILAGSREGAILVPLFFQKGEIIDLSFDKSPTLLMIFSWNPIGSNYKKELFKLRAVAN
jgi:hypothetical protein